MYAANPSQSKKVRELATQLYRDRHTYLLSMSNVELSSKPSPS